MGNKNILRNREEDNKHLIIHVKNFINEDKTTYYYIAERGKENFNYSKKKKNCINQKSLLSQLIESKTVIDCSLEIFSKFLNSALNHQVNSSLYNAVTIPKLNGINISENNLDSEIMSLWLDWIDNNLKYSERKINYCNWTPVRLCSSFDNLEDNYSSIHGSEDFSEINKENSIENLNNLNEKINQKLVRNGTKKLKENIQRVNISGRVTNPNVLSPINNKINSDNIKNKNHIAINSSNKIDFDQKTVNSILNIIGKSSGNNENKLSIKNIKSDNPKFKNIKPEVNDFKINEMSKVDIPNSNKNDLMGFHTFKPNENFLSTSGDNVKILEKSIKSGVALSKEKINKDSKLKLVKKSTIKKTNIKTLPKKKINGENNQLQLGTSELQTANFYINDFKIKNEKIEQIQTDESPKKIKQKKFVDLILKSFTPLLDTNEDDINENEYFKNDDPDNREKIKINESIKKKFYSMKYSSKNLSKYKQKNIKKRKENLKKNRIRIDIRTMLDDDSDLDKKEISKSSTFNLIEQPSKIKNENTPKTKCSIKTISDYGKITRKNSAVSLIKKREYFSSVDIGIKMKKGERENMTNEINVNETPFTKFNGNNLNSFHTFNQSYSTMNNIQKKLSNLNSKKQLTYSSKRGSKNITDMENNFSPRILIDDIILNLDLPKFDLDLTPLNNQMPYSEILRQFKKNNKFLFEITNEEKNLNDKLKSFNCDIIHTKD